MAVDKEKIERYWRRINNIEERIWNLRLKGQSYNHEKRERTKLLTEVHNLEKEKNGK